MKTHELAKSLRALAAVLDAGPNVSVEQLRLHSDAPSSGQLALNVSTLVELSRVDKEQWLAFVNELGFPLDIRRKDGSRNILGKLLNYLESNPSAREQLKTKASSKGSQASPELMRAFSSLLKDSP